MIQRCDQSRRSAVRRRRKSSYDPAQMQNLAHSCGAACKDCSSPATILAVRDLRSRPRRTAGEPNSHGDKGLRRFMGIYPRHCNTARIKALGGKPTDLAGQLHSRGSS